MFAFLKSTRAERRARQLEINEAVARIRQYLYEHGEWIQDDTGDIWVRIQFEDGFSCLFIQELTD